MSGGGGGGVIVEGEDSLDVTLLLHQPVPVFLPEVRLFRAAS